MDKQKSYGKNFEQTKLKHKFSLRFVLLTLGACVFATVIVIALIGVK